jgi:lambda family phage tail tape measure protein
MATTYGILIEMQADIARLQKDMAESKRAITSFTDSAIRSFRNLGGVIGVTFGAASLLEISKWFVELVKTVDDLDEAAQGVGTTAVALAELRASAQLAGVESNKLEQALAKLAGRIDDAASGNKDAIFAFKQLGVSIKDASGDILATDEVLAQIADRFRTFKDSTEKTAAAGVLFGDRLGKTLIPFLNQGSEGLRRNVGLTDEMVKKNLEAQRSIDELSIAWTKVKFALAGAAAEVIRWFSVLGGRESTTEDIADSLRFQISKLERELKNVEGGGLIERWIFGDPATRKQRIEERVKQLRAELEELLSRAGIDRFISGTAAVRGIEVDRRAPQLQRNKEAEAFLENLQKQVRQLELSEGQVLRIEAAEKGVTGEAEAWIRKLEEAKQKLRVLEILEQNITAQERVREQSEKAIGRGADLFAGLKIQAEEIDFSDLQRKRAEIEREFSSMRAEVALSGLTGEDLQAALDRVDEWRSAVLDAVNDWNQKLEGVRRTLRELEAIEERITAQENARGVVGGALTRASGIFAGIKQETEFARMTEFERRRARINQEFSEMRAVIASSGLTGEDLDNALSMLDEWHSSTLKALREQEEELRTWSAGWDQAMREYVDDVTNGAKEAQEAFRTMTKGFEDLLMDFIQTGRLNMMRFIQDIAAMLLRAEIRKLIVNVFEFFGLGVAGKQFGGTVAALQPVLVGEKGPEIFVPAANGSIIPNERIGTAGGPSVVINQNIKIDSRSDRAVILAAMEENRQRTIASIGDMMRRRSPVFSG